MDVTQKIYNIIKERHIPVKAVCEGANLPLKVMYSTLKENGKRKDKYLVTVWEFFVSSRKKANIK